MRTIEQATADLAKAREAKQMASKQEEVYLAELQEMYQAVMQALSIGAAGNSD